jgi:hypothetical protein
MLKYSERNLPPEQRRGIHRAVLMDQDGTTLIGVMMPDPGSCGVKGGQGRSARELVRPFRTLDRCIRAVRRFVTFSR